MTASVAGCLNAWIDFNGNGVLTDSGRADRDRPGGGRGRQRVTVAVPATAQGVLYSRFRFTQACGQGGASTDRAGDQR